MAQATILGDQKRGTRADLPERDLDFIRSCREADIRLSNSHAAKATEAIPTARRITARAGESLLEADPHHATPFARIGDALTAVASAHDKAGDRPNAVVFLVLRTVLQEV